jgi:cytochrome c oxidase subunit 2
MFWYGYIGYRDFKHFSSDNFFEAKVTGRMWLWEYEYPNGVTLQNDIYLPVGKPINLKIVSVDVNHSFYIPAFRIKQDAVPGFDNFMKFEVNEPGVYDIYCAEYCGLQHAYMLGKVHVLPQEEFNKWMADQEAAMAKAAAEAEAAKAAAPAEDAKPAETAPAAASGSSH